MKFLATTILLSFLLTVLPVSGQGSGNLHDPGFSGVSLLSGEPFGVAVFGTNPLNQKVELFYALPDLFQSSTFKAGVGDGSPEDGNNDPSSPLDGDLYIDETNALWVYDAETADWIAFTTPGNSFIIAGPGDGTPLDGEDDPVAPTDADTYQDEDGNLWVFDASLPGWSETGTGVTADPVNHGQYTGTIADGVFEIYRSDVPGEWTTNATRQSIRDDWCPDTSNVGYVDAVNGDDANAGTDITVPVRTLQYALATLGFELIYMAPGNYWPWTYNDATIKTMDFSLIAMEENTVTIGFLGDLAGGVTQNITHTHLRDVQPQGNISQVYRTDVFDKWGAPVALKSVADLATCAITPESYWKQAPPNDVVINSSGLTVGTGGASAVGARGDIEIASYSDSNLWLGVSEDGANDRQWYFENIRFAGHPVKFECHSTSGASKLCLSNCEIVHVMKNTSQDAMSSLGVWQTMLFHTDIFYCSNKDLANYHANGAQAPYAFEINCKMVGAAITNPGADPWPHQASTIHDNGQITRVNGIYAFSWQGIGDTGVNTISWNLGCKFLDNEEASVWALDGVEINIDTCYFSGNPTNGHMFADGITPPLSSPVINYVRTNGYSAATAGAGTVNKLNDATP